MKKLETPFGSISAREWDGLRGLGADPDHIAFFVEIRTRSSADGITRDSRKSLALRMNRSVDFIDGMVAWHDARGTIRSSEPRAFKGGPRGFAWVVDREALTFEEWPEESRKTAVLFWEEVARREPLVSSPLLPKRAANLPEESRKLTRREPQTDANNPDMFHTKKRETSSFLEENARWVETLAEEWRTARVQANLEKWHDRNALKWLRESARTALANGCTRHDAEHAVEAHVEEDWADTREFEQWAVDARDERLREERAEAEHEKHVAEMDAHIAKVDAEWAVKEAAGDPIALERKRNREKLGRATLSIRPWVVSG